MPRHVASKALRKLRAEFAALVLAAYRDREELDTATMSQLAERLELPLQRVSEALQGRRSLDWIVELATVQGIDVELSVADEPEVAASKAEAVELVTGLKALGVIPDRGQR